MFAVHYSSVVSLALFYMKTICQLILCLLPMGMWGQLDLSYYLPQDITYNPEIPTPKSVLGYEVGEWHISHDQQVFYMRTLAAASDRIHLVEIGKTYEGRPLLHLIYTSPSNQERLEEIRQEHVQLSDPDRSGSLNLNKMPGVVWMGYSIHGNEPSGGNAAPLVAYYLAAAQGSEIDKLLDEMVIILDPCYNPDGFHRFSSWVNMHRGINRVISDDDNREQNEAWPGGRTNHFWFDLNRDWLPTQHPESQARIAQFHRWKPNWLTDHHEMGTNSTFFFQPGVPSRNNPLTPPKVFELTNKVAEYHARALDKIGSLYYTKEGYDDFYYGKGSTYPDVNGSVGILFEQASARGHAQDSDHGVLTLAFAVRNQFVTSLSTLAGTHDLRKELLGYQRTFYKTALQEAAEDPTHAYVVRDDQDPARMHHFISMLQRHQVGVYQLKRDYNLGDQGAFNPENSYVIPLKQPQYRLIKSMFERRTEFTDSLFYDVSAWTLPLAFNLPVTAISARTAARQNFLGDLVETTFPTGTLTGEKSNYAYLLDWKGYYAPRALNRLFEAGLRVKVGTQTFQDAGGNAFAPGTLLVPVVGQTKSPDEIFELIQVISKEDAIDVVAVASGFSSQGVDLGSRSFQPLDMPRIALLVGDGVSSYDAGEVWHLMDQRYHMKISLVPAEELSGVDLHKYNTLIMVNGNYGSLGESQRNKLNSWVNNGGTLIAARNTLRWLSSRKLANISFKGSPYNTRLDSVPFFNRSNLSGSRVIGGAIFQANMDLSHPIAYGYTRPEISVFRNTSLFMQPERTFYNSPIRYTEEPLQAGYTTPENEKQLAKTAVVNIQRSGRGKIIMFTDNPNFRAFWYGTNKLFANAVFFGGVM